MIWMSVDSLYNDFDIRLCITGIDLFLISFCVFWCNFIILFSIFLISWIMLFLILVDDKEKFWPNCNNL